MFGNRGIEGRAISYAAVEDSAPKQALIRLVELLSGQPRLVRVYKRAREALRPGDDIFDLALRHLDIRVRFSPERLAAVPRSGPLVVVANHPFGVVDGLVLCHLVSRVRCDFKVVAMSTLCRVPEVRDHVLPINFASTREAALTSARSRATARALLRAGGCLVIFPAGAVATSRRLFGPAEDAPWHPFAGRLVHGSAASVLPVRFTGQNSPLFHLASRVSPTLRLSLLLGEARRRIGTQVEAHLGEVLPYEALRSFKDAAALVSHLRAVTHAIPYATATATASSARIH
jgi:putative hemolysin